EGEVLVAAFLEGLLDLRQVLVRNYLQVELTIEGQHRHLHLAQGRPWIVGEEVTEPRAVEGLDRVSDQGVGAARRLELVRRQRRRFLSRAAGSFSVRTTSIIRRIDADSLWIFSSDVPSARAMRSLWRTRTSGPGTPVPASMTTKATSLDWLAASGPTTPPSLWPTRPIRSPAIFECALRNRTPARASWAKSAEVESDTLPVEPPTPR